VKVVALHVSALIASLPRVETQAKTLLQTAHASGLSFGLDDNYLDDDIARLLGCVRSMRLMAMRWAAQQEMGRMSRGQRDVHAVQW
jgi:hypothetical protein